MSTVTAPASVGASLPLALIRVSPDNPRRQVDDRKLDELAASIKELGVLEPILVRPVPQAKNGVRYEIVAGECRYRAAGRAGLDAIPAISRELSDTAALEIAMVENLQRQDLHALDEAEGFDRLLREHKYTLDGLAKKLGKSRAYVQARARLVALPKILKDALLADKIPVSVALLVARIPNPKHQGEAAKEILSGYSGEPMTPRQASQHIQNRYMLSLGSAPFDTADATLVPAAGACSACPKRSGTDRALFEDVSRADLCTDASCFGGKKEAAWVRVEVKAREGGARILDAKTAKKVFPYGDGRVSFQSEYADLEETCPEDPKHRPWRSLLGKHAPKHLFARDPQGRARHLVLKREAVAALTKAGHRFQAADAKQDAAAQKESDALRRHDGARRRRLEILRRTTAAVAVAVVARAEAKEPPAAFWTVLLGGIVDGSWHDVIRTVAKRRGWNAKNRRPEEAMTEAAREMTTPQLRALVLDLVINRGGFSTYGILTLGKQITAAAAAYGVDVKKVEAQVKAGLAANGKEVRRK